MNNTLFLKDINLTLTGYVSHDYIGFYIPELKICLDSGVILKKNYKYIFISNINIKNNYSLIHNILSFTNQNHIQLIVPYNTKQYFKNYIKEAAFLLTNSNSIDINKLCLIQEIQNNQLYQITDNIEIGIINNLNEEENNVSYVIYEINKKIKKKYKNFINLYFIDDKKKYYIEKKILLIYYIGPITNYIFNSHYLKKNKCRYLIMECKYVLEMEKDEEEKNKIKNNKKIVYYEEIKDFIIDNTQILFLLINFSIHYLYTDLKEFFKNKHDNVYIWPFK